MTCHWLVGSRKIHLLRQNVSIRRSVGIKLIKFLLFTVCIGKVIFCFGRVDGCRNRSRICHIIALFRQTYRKIRISHDLRIIRHILPFLGTADLKLSMNTVYKKTFLRHCHAIPVLCHLRGLGCLRQIKGRCTRRLHRRMFHNSTFCIILAGITGITGWII